MYNHEYNRATISFTCKENHALRKAKMRLHHHMHMKIKEATKDMSTSILWQKY